MVERIAVIGLGYVGLPVAVGMARAHGRVVGFDVDPGAWRHLRAGVDATRRVRARASWRGWTGLQRRRGRPRRLQLLHRHRADADRRRPAARPRPLRRRLRDRSAGPCGRAGWWCSRARSIPGLTEEICGPLLAEASGLRQGQDFHARLLARADQSRRPGAPAGDHHQGDRGRQCRRRWRGWRRIYGPVAARPGCTSPRRSRSPRPPR